MSGNVLTLTEAKCSFIFL